MMEVKLCREITDRHFLKIKLTSRVKNMFGCEKILYFDDFLSGTGIKRAVEITGGALAEFANETYKDNFEPSECAKNAIEAFDEAMAKFEERINGNPYY